MKKFKVIFYEGNVENLGKEIRSTIVEAESIDKVGPGIILTANELENSHYYVGHLIDEKSRSFDYGSHTKFVWVKEVD